MQSACLIHELQHFYYIPTANYQLAPCPANLLIKWRTVSHRGNILWQRMTPSFVSAISTSLFKTLSLEQLVQAELLIQQSDDRRKEEEKILVKEAYVAQSYRTKTHYLAPWYLCIFNILGIHFDRCSSFSSVILVLQPFPIGPTEGHFILCLTLIMGQ